MLINKAILKICKFFGFRKNEEHVTDVTINYPGKIDNRDDALFGSDKISEEDVLKIKQYIMEEFRKDPILQKRCCKVKQVWLTFYENTDERTGSIMKMLYYDDDALYYPYEKDRQSFKRNEKISKII